MVAAGTDWLILTASIEQTPAFVEAADRLIVEVNHNQPLGLQAIHDVYHPDAPLGRGSIPLTDPQERIGDACI